MTTLAEFDTMLASYDWFHEMSDDHSIWSRGKAAQGRVLAIKKESEQHRQLYELWAKHHYNGKPWGTEPFTKEQLDVERARMLGVTP